MLSIHLGLMTHAENPQHLLLEVADGGARRVVSVAEIV